MSSSFGNSAQRTSSLPVEIVCNGKVSFQSYAQAAAVLSRKGTKARPARSTYHCGHCGQWHIGTDSGRISQKRTAEFKRMKNHE